MVIPDNRKRWVLPSSMAQSMWPGSDIPPGWLPVSIAGGIPTVVRWIRIGEAPLAEPLFNYTLKRLRGSNFPAHERETELSTLERGAARLPCVAPAGIVIHMTRCGSTLLANAFRSAMDAVVLSEVPVVARVMEWIASPSRHWATTGSRLFLPLTSVFAHYQGDCVPRDVVIKCGTEGLLLLRAIRTVLPDIPCLVLIRNPIEVLVSIAANTPRGFTEWYEFPRNPILGGPPPDALAGGHIEFWAWLMGRFCSDALALLDDRCRVLDYSDITPDVARRVGEYFHLSVSGEGEPRLHEAFRFSAKHPERLFESDSARKRFSTSDAINASAAKWADGPYQELRKRAAGWDRG